MASGKDEFGVKHTKKYFHTKQLNANGTITHGNKANTGATMLYSRRPNGICYISDNVQGFLKILYKRFLIGNRKLA